MVGHKTKVIVHSARFSEFRADDWWHSRDEARIAIVELEKLFWDVVRHPIS